MGGDPDCGCATHCRAAAKADFAKPANCKALRLKWTPHEYMPDYQAMGDCLTCGNTREDCERFNAEHAKRESNDADYS